MAATQMMSTMNFQSGGMQETKTTIPIVTHVITDEDIGALQVGIQQRSISYKKSHVYQMHFDMTDTDWYH